MNRLQLGSRKIQKLSKALYVSLPKPWTTTNNAKKGDTVDISINSDGSLRIIPVTAAKQTRGYN